MTEDLATEGAITTVADLIRTLQSIDRNKQVMWYPDPGLDIVVLESEDGIVYLNGEGD